MQVFQFVECLFISPTYISLAASGDTCKHERSPALIFQLTDRSRLENVRNFSSRERPDRLRYRIPFLYLSSVQQSRKSIVTHSRDLTVNLPQKLKAIKSLSLPRRSFNPGAMTYRDKDGLLRGCVYREIGMQLCEHFSIITGNLS